MSLTLSNTSHCHFTGNVRQPKIQIYTNTWATANGLGSRKWKEKD